MIPLLEYIHSLQILYFLLNKWLKHWVYFGQGETVPEAGKDPNSVKVCQQQVSLYPALLLLPYTNENIMNVKRRSILKC